MFKEAIKNIIGRSAEHYACPDDYFDENDGFMHCAKCGGAKQESFKLLGYDVTVYIPCPCKKEEEEKEKALEAEIEKERKRSAKIQKFKDQSGIKGRNLCSTFDSYKQTAQNKKQYSIAKRYVENFDNMENKDQGLLFYGNTGTGKTFTSCCIGNAMLEKGHSVYFTSTVNLLKRKKSYRSDNDEGEDPDRLIETVDLLILDDLNAERHTDYALETIYSVIEARYTVMKPMIVSTNMNMDQMQNADSITEQRIYERILECCYPVQFNVESFRKEKALSRYGSARSDEKEMKAV